MNFISENIINPVIDRISNEDGEYEQLTKEFAEAQPFLLAYLLSEGFDVLTEEEKSMLFYLAMIIYYSVLDAHESIETITLESIQNTDEKNWTAVDQNKFKTFKEIADHFFIEYTQEDLLAFVEDALSEDEEYQISNIGRNVIFVSMRSFIDAFDININSN